MVTGLGPDSKVFEVPVEFLVKIMPTELKWPLDMFNLLVSRIFLE